MKLKNISIVLTAVATALCACESREDVRVQQPDESEYIYEVRDGRLTAEAAMADLRSTLEAMGDHGRAEKVSAMEMSAIVTAADFRAARQSAGMMLAPQDGGTETADDTLLYVVNFGDGEGYAVMSTDASLGGDNLIALAESGSITIEDIVNPDTAKRDNPFLYMPGIRPMSDGPSTGLTNPGGGGGLGWGQPGGMGNMGYIAVQKYGPWEEYSEYGPYTNVRYHQGAPYNNLCPKKDKDGPAGCASIALLTLFSCNENPSIIGGISGDWELLKHPNMDSSTHFMSVIPQWVRRLGEDCNTKYRADYAYAFSADIIDALHKYSYNAQRENKPGLEKVRDCIMQGKALMCGGIPNGLLFKGHYWVLDGYMLQRRETWIQIDGKKTSVKYEYRELIHCNWGWGGTSNGYYKYREFNPKDDCIIKDAGVELREESREHGDWHFWVYFY